jgi:hypothetical protein
VLDFEPMLDKMMASIVALSTLTTALQINTVVTIAAGLVAISSGLVWIWYLIRKDIRETAKHNDRR